MFPTLLTVGSLTVTSFGVSLTVGVLCAVFVIWRLALIYDLDKEKVMDVVLLSLFGGLIFSRIYYVLFNLQQFTQTSSVSNTTSFQFERMLLISKFPGLSFWGTFFGVVLTVAIFSRRLKLNFWQVADIGIIGAFLALGIGSIGCFLGSCQYGQESNLFFAVTQVGLVGKRFPLQLLEAFLYFLAFMILWQKALRFHFYGKIFVTGLMFLAGIKFILESMRGDRQEVFRNWGLGHIYALAIFISASYLFYRLGKRSVLGDLMFLKSAAIDPKKRQVVLFNLSKKWYNFWIDWKVSVQKTVKSVLRRINVKFTPPKI